MRLSGTIKPLFRLRLPIMIKPAGPSTNPPMEEQPGKRCPATDFPPGLWGVSGWQLMTGASSQLFQGTRDTKITFKAGCFAPMMVEQVGGASRKIHG
jgi:hypothetical protein